MTYRRMVRGPGSLLPCKIMLGFVKGRQGAAFFLCYLLCNSAILAADFEWRLPPGFPPPRVPADNPMSIEKVQLGQRLFFDTRLSINNTYSCASCHQPERAFTDARSQAVGVRGDLHARGVMSLVNAAYNLTFGWASQTTDSLEKQVLVPLFNQHPPEMGLALPIDSILNRLQDDPVYSQQFALVFAEPTPVNLGNIAKAIAAFERTLIFGNSPYDRYVFLDERTALTDQQQQGMELFFSERIGCSRCHSGFNFSGPVVFQSSPERANEFHNNGAHLNDKLGELGLQNETGQLEDYGLFRAPTLRNIAVTAPYMHDGSINTLTGVVQHYIEIGKRIDDQNPAQVDSSLKPFQLTQEEMNALISFLHSLTDAAFSVKTEVPARQ